MDFVYIGIILFIAVVIACIVVYFKKEEDNESVNNSLAKKMERDEFSGKKILYIGNSYGDDTIKYVREIAQSLSIKNLVIANLFMGGSSLQNHFENAQNNKKEYEYRKNENGEWTNKIGYSLKDGLDDEKWDLIVLQQQSSLNAFWSSFDPHLSLLKSYIKKVCPTALLAFNMTWAYPQNSQNPQFSKFDFDSEKMYERICSVASTRIDNDFDFYCVIPTGTAIQNAKELMGESLYRDDIHLNEKGRFLASLCFVKEVFNPDLFDLAYAPDCVDRDTADNFILAVNSAYENPFFVSAVN